MFRRLRDRGVPKSRIRTPRTTTPRVEAIEPRLLLNGDLSPIPPARPPGSWPEGLDFLRNGIGQQPGVDQVVAPPPPINLAQPAPRVVSVERLGVYGSPIRYVIRFDRPMNASVIPQRGQYLLEVGGADGKLNGVRDAPIPIASITVDSTRTTVTIIPGRRISLHEPVRLTINGDLAGVYSADGILLDGNNDGRAGGNYVAILQGFGARPPRPLPPWIFRGPGRRV